MMPNMAIRAAPEDDAAVFGRLFAALYDDIVRFVQRRAPGDVVDDVVADTFLVAWRRITELPHDLAEARPWLFAVTRNTLANHHRGRRRFRNLAVHLAAQPRPMRDDTDGIAQRLAVAEAFRRLRPGDQEVLALVAWDDLSNADAARVLGISASAFGARLSRARARLRDQLASGAEQGDLS